MLPCHFRPYELQSRELLTEGSQHSVFKLRFALTNADDMLGASQPCTHVKIRAPNSCKLFFDCLFSTIDCSDFKNANILSQTSVSKV